FFFSSRRRHTRSTRDWSSDVCSSDLDYDAPIATVSNTYARRKRRDEMKRAMVALAVALGILLAVTIYPTSAADYSVSVSCSDDRSEERRVGKEWRCRSMVCE